MTTEPANPPLNLDLPDGPPPASFDDVARYESINVHNFEDVPQIRALPPDERHDVRVVAQVLPFKSNRYVVDELIDWDAVPDDPIYRLTFPHRDMLEPAAFRRIEALLDAGASGKEIKVVADEIRMSLNPHPAGQLDHNVPSVNGQSAAGHAAQVPRDGAVLREPGPDLPRLLHLLLPLAAVRGAGGAEVRDARGANCCATTCSSTTRSATSSSPAATR